MKDIFRIQKLRRFLNRHKAKKCTRDPTLESDVHLEYLDIESDYLRGDIRMEEDSGIVASHLLFATGLQLELLRQCSTIYLDGTFKLTVDECVFLIELEITLCGEITVSVSRAQLLNTIS